MAWPSRTDYHEAVQNLRLSVGDEELRAGEVAANHLGLPMLWSGNFADVYKIDCRTTGSTWALKCFTRDVPGLADRYRNIEAHLREARFPFTVDFHYQPQGIRIAGQWFPVVKMRWVEGKTLNQFVEEHLHRPRTLKLLLDLWVELAARLRVHEVAHADLQHGNVLLVPMPNGSFALRLVDYDGMFVPCFAGSRSSEFGHPAYQHPQRLAEGTYGLEVDRFSHLVIYTAIRCLMVRQGNLWQRFSNGDNLLFREADFRSPASSETFRALWALEDPAAQALVGRLSLACLRPLEECPLLDEIIDQGEVLPLGEEEQKAAERLLGPATPRGASTGSPTLLAGIQQRPPTRPPEGASDPLPPIDASSPPPNLPAVKTIPAPEPPPIAAPPQAAVIAPVASRPRLPSGYPAAGVERRPSWTAVLYRLGLVFGGTLAGMLAGLLLILALSRFAQRGNGRAEPPPEMAAVPASPSEPATEPNNKEETRTPVVASLPEPAKPKPLKLEPEPVKPMSPPAARPEPAKKEADTPPVAPRSEPANLRPPILEPNPPRLEPAPRKPMPPPTATPEPAAEEEAATTPSQPSESLHRLPARFTNSIGMKLVRIPAGTFLMGATGTGRGVYDYEMPQHRVRITRPFYLGATEVTQAEYQRVMGTNPSQFRGASLPVEMVTWHDAVDFCRRLSEKDGKQYRLPTEAEWEYACRAGTTTPHPFPESQPLDECAWYGRNSNGSTHPVARKRPNPWGLYDMLGNVYEWCSDGFGLYYYKDSPSDDPPGSDRSGARVLRGESWEGWPEHTQSFHRTGFPPTPGKNSVGFRVVCVPPKPVMTEPADPKPTPR